MRQAGTLGFEESGREEFGESRHDCFVGLLIGGLGGPENGLCGETF